MLLTRQLATLVGSGMPLEQSLRLMADQAENVTIKRLVSAIRSQVAEGHSLAHALEKAPVIFPSDYIATISAGEETGHLEQVLERLADDVAHSGKAKQSMMTALIYPLLMMTVAITVIILLLVYVVPQVTRVFGQMDQELPGLTLALLAISEWLKNYGFYLFILLSGSLVTFLLMLRDVEKKEEVARSFTQNAASGLLVYRRQCVGLGAQLGYVVGQRRTGSGFFAYRPQNGLIT